MFLTIQYSPFPKMEKQNAITKTTTKLSSLVLYDMYTGKYCIILAFNLHHIKGKQNSVLHYKCCLFPQKNLNRNVFLFSFLGFIKSLSGLNLTGNPLEFPPPQVIERGTQVSSCVREINIKFAGTKGVFT